MTEPADREALNDVREVEWALFTLCGLWLESGRPITREYLDHPVRQQLLNLKAKITSAGQRD